MNDFLVYDAQDNVGAAVVDVNARQSVKIATLDGETQLQLTAFLDIPLGHKIA